MAPPTPSPSCLAYLGRRTPSAARRPCLKPRWPCQAGYASDKGFGEPLAWWDAQGAAQVESPDTAYIYRERRGQSCRGASSERATPGTDGATICQLWKTGGWVFKSKSVDLFFAHSTGHAPSAVRGRHQRLPWFAATLSRGSIPHGMPPRGRSALPSVRRSWPTHTSHTRSVS